MKIIIRQLALFAMFILALQRTNACDVCGSAVNASYFGILPQYTQNFIGLRYLKSSFNSKELPSLFEVNNPDYSEQLHRAEIYGRYYVTDRIMLFGFLPYQYNSQAKANGETKAQGLSDITLQANYIFINTGDSGRLNWRNTLSAGGGVKLPTGKYSVDKAASQQTGTGSFDYIFNIIYTTRYKKAGLNIDANARINTAGSSYEFGNRYATSARLFFWHKYRQLSFLPSAGLMFEQALKDRKENVVQRYTGGNGTYAVAGLDVYFRRFSLGCSFAKPLNETINENYAVTKHRLTVQTLFLF